MEESVMEDVEEIDTIITELEISKGTGNLILCVVNSPAYRDRIIHILRGRFSSEVIYIANGEQIIRTLKEQDFYGADVLIWLMPEEATEDLLNALNNFRELFYEVKIPNLVFYNQAFSDRVIREAPDFWRYRGNYYEFEEVERGMAFEAIETLASPFSYQDKEDLLRRKRINEYLLERVRDRKEKAKILSELGTICYHLGELDKALNYHEKALGLYDGMGIKEEMAAVLRKIGNVYLTKGGLNKALDYYEKVVKLSEELRRKEEMAAVLGNIGIVHRIKGELDKALEYHKKALKLDAELGRKDGMTADYGNIGNVYYDKREFDNALEYHKKALKLDAELGRKERIAIDLGNMGNVYLTKGELEKALEYYEKALKLNEELGRKEGVAIQLGNIGHVHYRKGELHNALEYYEKALRIFKEIGSRIETARVLMSIGDVLLMKGDKERAIAYYQEAQGLAAGSYLFEEVSKRLKRLT